MLTDEWIDAICKDSRESRDAVEATLTKLGIALRPELALRRRLHVQSISFSGERRGTNRDGPFAFDWRDLGPGLWAVTSGRNFRGKTTVLGSLLWALRGRSTDLSDTVRNWINQLTVRLSLDGRTIEIKLENAASSAGHLAEVAADRTNIISEFSDADAFERTMATFFMDQLNLSPMRVFNTRGDGLAGTSVQHGWPWLSTALHIGSRNEVLFGETAVGALPLRMMQMFVAVPSANTLADIKNAEGQLRVQSTTAQTTRSHLTTQRVARLADLNAQLASVVSRLSQLRPLDEDLAAQAAASRAYVAADERHRQLVGRLSGAEATLADAQSVHDQDRRLAQQFKEERAAGFVFHALQPVCCPACDTGFDAARRRETEQRHTCLVCGTQETTAGDPAPEEERLQASITASAAALDKARMELTALKSFIASAARALESARNTCNELNQSIARNAERSALEAQRIGLAARIEELGKEADDTSAPVSADGKILASAEKVTRNLLNTTQDSVLAEISKLIANYGRRFGIENLRETQLDGAGRLRVKIADTNTSFTKLTDGERTRIKVAAIIAMLRLSEKRGLGRHPGLLLIDSPGNNETVPTDYQALLAGLVDIVKELPHLQIIAAACANPTISAHVPPQNQRSAEGDAYLW